MHSTLLATGWGSRKNNTLSINLPDNVKNCMYFKIIFEARHFRDPLSWKLRDESGNEHKLPYSFKQGDPNKFTIIVDGSESSDYKYDCTLHSWPKELQMPKLEFNSIASVQICAPERYSTLPLGRHRRKGANKWTIGSTVVFQNCDEIIECQQYYRLTDSMTKEDIVIESPIIETKCMWQQFDIEKSSTIDYEAMIFQKIFSIKFDSKKIEHTKYSLTMTLLDSIEHPDYNKDIEIKPTSDFHLTLGSRYQFKMHIQNLNVSFSRIIQVPYVAPIEKIFWSSIFGAMDPVTFSTRKSETATRWIDWYAGEGEDYETNIETRTLTLYRHGVYAWKYTFQKSSEDNKIEERSSFGGCFLLKKLDSEHFRIDLLKLFKNKTIEKPSVTLTPSYTSTMEQLPAAFQLPELLYLITSSMRDKDRLNLRLVCKTWCQLFPPTISGTLTSQSATVYNCENMSRMV